MDSIINHFLIPQLKWVSFFKLTMAPNFPHPKWNVTPDEIFVCICFLLHFLLSLPVDKIEIVSGLATVLFLLRGCTFSVVCFSKSGMTTLKQTTFWQTSLSGKLINEFGMFSISE